MKARIGIVGVGAISQVAHIPAVLSHEKATLVALCDVDEAKLYKLSEKYKIERIYTDFEDMLKDEEIDGVIISTPNYLHYPMVIGALEYNKYVLCEKPLGVNSEEVEKIVKMARKYKGKLMVSFHNRLRPDVITLRRYIRAGEIGDVYYAKAGWLRKTAPEDFPTWREDKSLSGGGVILTLGVHILDHALWIMEKKPISVSSSMHFGDDIEDAGIFMIRFDDGSFLTVEVGWTLMFEKDFTYFNLYGDKGFALLFPFKIQKLYKNEIVEITKRKERENPYKTSFKEQIRRFAEMIIKKRSPPFPVEDALLIARIIDAAYLSQKEKKEVELW